jgi:hypothetical protein
VILGENYDDRLLELESKVGIKFGGQNEFCISRHGDPKPGMNSGFWNEN